MYEQFKNELSMQLNLSELDENVIKTIWTCLDIVAYNYDFSPKATELVPYNNELPKLAKEFLVVKSIKGLSKQTLYNYKRFLFIFFFTIKKQPEQVKKRDIEMFLYWYQKERNISNRSLDKVLDCLKSFYSWMYNSEYIERDPAKPIEPIRYEKARQDYLTEEELEVVRRYCVTLKEKALIELFFATGCRVAEVANMKITDIDFKEKTVRIFGKGNKHRIGFISVRAEFAIKDYLNSRTDSNPYLFVSDRAPHDKMSTAGIQKIIRLLAEKTGIQKKITCHTFRRTVSTILLNRGMSIEIIQQILGHEQISTTMIYAQVSLQNVYSQYKKYMF